MCVKAIVRIKPKRAASRGASSWEHAAKSPAAKNTAAVCPAERSKRRCSHSTSSEVTTNPLPAESRLNKPASSSTVRREVCNARRRSRDRRGAELVAIASQAAGR